MPNSHPVFEIVTTRTGAISIRNKIVNEIMHNPVGPWAEANALYIDQSYLAKRLVEPTSEELVVFDVGLGAAANALATLACVRKVGAAARPVRIVSFEKDLEMLRFALDHSSHFEHFAGFEPALEQLLRDGKWQDGGIAWELRHGNFLDLIDAEPHRPHLIYFDPYSPKMNQEMWSASCFTKLRAKCRTPAEGTTTLYTYSQSTRIRSSLIVAGFHVGYGLATGLKEETTQASTDRSALAAPLDQIWFSRWQRSHTRNSYHCAPGEESKEDQRVESYMSQMLGIPESARS